MAVGKLLSSALLWQLVAGFALGTAGVVAMQPREARQALRTLVAPVAPVAFAPRPGGYQ